jgi:hypothetical protein
MKPQSLPPLTVIEQTSLEGHARISASVFINDGERGLHADEGFRATLSGWNRQRSLAPPARRLMPIVVRRISSDGQP